MQLDALNAAGCDVIYTEHISGAKTARPQFDMCIKKLGKGDTLVVWKLDRMGRSMVHLCQTAADLKKRGAFLKVITQSIDTSTAAGMMFFQMLAAVAEFERALNSERVIAGIAARKARGLPVGKPQKLDSYEQEQVLSAVAMGMPFPDICEDFDIPEPHIYKILNRHYPKMDMHERIKLMCEQRGLSFEKRQERIQQMLAEREFDEAKAERRRIWLERAKAKRNKIREITLMTQDAQA